ncbi:MAG: type III PLP-dependent enzyme [Planctomycetaceae bacterium]|nr:type III PLP-dependent enzyme [Planctomycetaceae bacterium]
MPDTAPPTIEQPPAGKLNHVAGLVDRHFASVEGQLAIGGLSVAEIAARHGTPLFIYDQAAIARQLHLLRAALPERFDVFYSVKANPNQAFLRYFVAQGCGLEIASRGELYQALQAGCAPARIFFAGPGKTDADLAAALDHDLGEIHVESLPEARRLARLAHQRRTTAHIALRVNPAADVAGGGMRMGGKPAPFGVDEDQLDEVVAFAAESPWLALAGLHLYVGTQILDPELLLAQYQAALELARRIAPRLRGPLTTIDFGGGLGVPYFPHEKPLDLARLQEGLARMSEDIAADPVLRDVRFVLEPGRFLVAEAGVYVSRVTDLKTSRGKTFVVTDGGMHHHLAASGNLGQTIKRNFPLAVINKLGQPESQVVDIVGPLCTPLDTLARSASLPPIEVGDLIGVFQAGAYARTASPLGFLSHAAPPEVLVAEGRDRLIRRRGNDEDFLADQILSEPHDAHA